VKRSLFTAVILAAIIGTATAALAGNWSWPVVGPVIRAFDPPSSPYGAGHRGIDIAAIPGSIVRSPAAGTVVFAGSIGMDLFVSIDHGGGLRTTYSWVSKVLVRKGESVLAGQPVALSGYGHPGSATPSLHFGVTLNGMYVDPLDYLLPLDVSSLIRLAPLEPG
jgi:murein DD-endopeptidase MepM/ murein hydrolase activator NlpD